MFKHWSKEFYPNANDLVKYFQDFAVATNLLQYVHFETTIELVTKVEVEGQSLFEITTKHQGQPKLYHCQIVYCATGVTNSYVPNVIGISEHSTPIEKMSQDPEFYANKSVLVMGKGNSALEAAEFISQTAAHVHLLSTSPIKLAYESHFVGHVRSVNLRLIDHYQLKSLDAFLENDLEGKYRVSTQTHNQALELWNVTPTMANLPPTRLLYTSPVDLTWKPSCVWRMSKPRLCIKKPMI